MRDLLARWLRGLAGRLDAVTVVAVGKADDGLVAFGLAGTDLDKQWGELLGEFKDAFDAWRKNPLARRIVGIVTAYVLGGDSIVLHSTYGPLDRFIQDLVSLPDNRWGIRQSDWCDELTRAGELFPTVHFNSADGTVHFRAVSASRIERVEWDEEDYEAETLYHEAGDVLGDGAVWYHPRAVPDRNGLDGESPRPVMLHYAVNRPVGCVRGESDLAPILPWLRRYSRWLEDRVRTNAAHRLFLWLVKVPSKLVRAKEEQYRKAPSPGSVLVVDRDNEEWEAVSPRLEARDVAADGRAIRWMIVAGGPGLSLLDIGESETANLASSRTLAEQRRRFLRRRQAYFGYILADVMVQAWNRVVALGLRRGRQATLADVTIGVPDIAPEDNEALAAASDELMDAFGKLGEMVGSTSALKRIAARLLFKFLGERVSEQEFEEIVGKVMAE